ncbi:hypothetical protein H6P81_011124 [Aristolochia fimbriata]|uniref:Uncharacterized protein n=1 Tax=Aristolochia fimbriata TaxID=158543 RepID=A0AAV7ERE4_ARIFI|nr:hypothetical protein H6P81_011124 [Aristolochia fimbriata]
MRVQSPMLPLIRSSCVFGEVEASDESSLRLRKRSECRRQASSSDLMCLITANKKKRRLCFECIYYLMPSSEFR